MKFLISNLNYELFDREQRKAIAVIGVAVLVWFVKFEMEIFLPYFKVKMVKKSPKKSLQLVFEISHRSIFIIQMTLVSEIFKTFL